MIHKALLLALGFVSPALLGWLALAIAPLVIHWLFRRRYREVTWGAMQFLHEAARKQSRRTRLEQWLLLATRMLILVVVVLALARPHFAGTESFLRRQPPTLRILVLDCSLSMGRRAVTPRGANAELPRPVHSQSTATLFDAAKRAAANSISQASAGDRFLLVRMAGTEPRVLIQEPTLAVSAVSEEVQRLNPTFERGDVTATLRRLPELVSLKKAGERCEVTVFSDFQADNWNGVLTESEQASPSVEAARIWKQLADQATVVLQDIGPADPANASVVELQADPPILAAGQPVSVSVTVRNTGTIPLVQRPVELLLDGQPVANRTVELAVGQDQVVSWELPAVASGEHVLAARIAGDGLDADNQRWLPITVRSQLSVLLVNGRASARPRDAATFFVERALAPATRTSPPTGSGTSWLRVEAISEADFSQSDVRSHDVVFFCDVASLSAGDVGRLRQFVQSGGGFIVTLGPSFQREPLNDELFGSRGLVPIQLLDVVNAANQAESPFFGFDLSDDSHPLLREFRGNPGAGLETALIRQYARTERLAPAAPAEMKPVEVALKFSTGDPAILTQALGAGRCVVVTTSVDETWGEWPVWAPGFVPLMHELVNYAAAADARAHERLIGEPFVATFLGNPVDDVATVTLPNGEQRSLPVTQADGTSTVVFTETAQPGLYEIASLSESSRRQRWATHVDPRECEAARLSREQLSVTPSPSSVVLSEGPLDGSAQPETDDSNEHLARSLLWGVLALLAIEQGLAWRPTAGAWVFGGLVSLSLIWGATRSPIVVASVAIGLLLIVAVVELRQRLSRAS